MKTFKFVDYEKTVTQEDLPKTSFKKFFYLLLANFFDLFFVNILVVLLSIPIITMGPALAAANRVVFDIMRGEDSHIIKDFFHYFKSSFAQGMCCGLICIGFWVASFFALRFCIPQVTELPFLWVPIIFIVILSVVVILCMLYMFTLCGTSTLKTGQILKNSFILGISMLQKNIPPMLICTITLLPQLLLFPKPLPFTVIFGIILPIFISNFFVWKTVMDYVLVEEKSN